MALAFANIGITGNTVSGSQRVKKHRPKLLDLFVALLQSKERPAGLLLNEVGNLNDLLQDLERQEFNDLLRQAFQTADASEHGSPQIIWSDGETVAAFRKEVEVVSLSTLRFKPSSGVDTWRVVERFKVIGATEHGPCSLLVYNPVSYTHLTLPTKA